MEVGTKINFVYNYFLWETIDFELEEYTKEVANYTLKEIGFFEVVHNPELTINLANNKQLRLLNKEFLGKDYSTNVLSFPAASNIEDLTDSYIGDIAISFTKVRTEATGQGKSLKNHYTHMIVHAILHLVGYDHIDTRDAEIMEAAEVKILEKFKISDPYIDYELL